MTIRKILEKLNLDADALNELETRLNGFVDEKTSGLVNKNSELLGKLSKIKGIDIDLLIEQQKDNEVNDYIKHLKDGTTKEFLQSIKESERAKVEAEYKEALATKENDLKGWETKFNELLTSNDKNIVKETLRKELLDVKGINKEYIEDIISFAESQMEVIDNNGAREAVYINRATKRGDGNQSTIKDWFEKDAKKWMYEDVGGTGNGGKQTSPENLEFDEMDGKDLLDSFGM